METNGPPESVLAMVLTYDSPENLLLTLDAVSAQSRQPNAIMVVDNGGRITAEETLHRWKETSKVPITVIRENVNSGPGGGWAKALSLFLDSDHSHAWLLDDDIVGSPTCLEGLLREAAASTRTELIIPSVRQPNGKVTNYPAWHSVLISREIVEHVGVPRADFFWWAEDTEYLMWRIPNTGYPIRYLADVVVTHNKGRGEWGNPPWKYYYEARNSIYYHFHLRRGRGRWPRKVAFLVLRVVLREQTGRWIRFRMIVRGISDGLIGRLGKRVNPEDF